jgi:hypothetical protein
MARMIMAAAVIAAGLWSNPALACKGTVVILQDDFKTVDAAWDTVDGFAIESGQAKYSGKDAVGLYYNGNLFTDFDYCIDITMSKMTDPPQQSQGVVFWATDYDNRYMLLVSGDGQATIARKQNGKYIYPVAWRKFDAIKTDVGAVNSLRVVVKGGTVTANVNDKPFATLKGQPPKEGSQIGLYFTGPDPFVVTNLKVTNVP